MATAKGVEDAPASIASPLNGGSGRGGAGVGVCSESEMFKRGELVTATIDGKRYDVEIVQRVNRGKWMVQGPSLPERCWRRQAAEPNLRRETVKEHLLERRIAAKDTPKTSAGRGTRPAGCLEDRVQISAPASKKRGTNDRAWMAHCSRNMRGEEVRFSGYRWTVITHVAGGVWKVIRTDGCLADTVRLDWNGNVVE